MAGDLADDARRKILGQPGNWVKQFAVTEYVQNPPMIEKLHEEKQLALADLLDHREKVKSLELRVQELVLRNQSLQSEAGQARRHAKFAFSLSLVAGILASVGANVATGSSMQWTGWVMMTFAALVEGIAFFLVTRT